MIKNRRNYCNNNFNERESKKGRSSSVIVVVLPSFGLTPIVKRGLYDVRLSTLSGPVTGNGVVIIGREIVGFR